MRCCCPPFCILGREHETSTMPRCHTGKPRSRPKARLWRNVLFRTRDARRPSEGFGTAANDGRSSGRHVGDPKAPCRKDSRAPQHPKRADYHAAGASPATDRIVGVISAYQREENRSKRSPFEYPARVVSAESIIRPRIPIDRSEYHSCSNRIPYKFRVPSVAFPQEWEPRRRCG